MASKFGLMVAGSRSRKLNAARASLLLSLFVITFAGNTRAQHSRAKPKPDAGGGRIEISVPNIIAPRPRGSKQPEAKQTFFKLTSDEEGDWYYSTATITRKDNISSMVVGFIPRDLAEEREFYRRKFWNTDRVKADAYLGYTMTIYGVELLCASRQYRFQPAIIDAAGLNVIGVQVAPDDWQEWRATNGTPWEAARLRVCSPTQDSKLKTQN